MAATKTLAQLRTMVRELADQETSAPTTAFVDNTELDARINEALKQLYNLLIQARGQEYYFETTTFTSVADQNDYDLPNDFFRALGVSASDGTAHVPMGTWEWQELPRLRYREASGAVQLYGYQYRIKKDKLSIYPAPSGTAHTFYLDYVPAFAELASVNDKFDGVNGWEKWAALTAAIDIANKEENYELVQSLMAQRGVIQGQIEALAGERDAGRAPRIQDTRLDGGDFAWGLFFEEGT